VDYQVYKLSDPRDGKPRYVGMSRSAQKRFGQHLLQAKSEWMLSLQQEGLLPQLTIIESGLDRQSANERERYWIQHFLEQGMPLINLRKLPINKPPTERWFEQAIELKDPIVLTNIENGEEFYTASEASKLLGISRDTFYRSVRSRLQAYQLGVLKRTYYKLADIQALKGIRPVEPEKKDD